MHDHLPQTPPDRMTLTAPDGSVASAIGGDAAARLQRDMLPLWVLRQRWFAAKDEAPPQRVELRPLGDLDEPAQALMALDVTSADGAVQTYFLPLSALWDDEGARPSAPGLPVPLADLDHAGRTGTLIDGAFDARLPRLLLDAMAQGGTQGTLHFNGTDALRAMGDAGAPRQLGAEQSNLSIAFGERIILKIYRRLRAGHQPDVEVARFLTEVASYAHTPRYLGHLDHRGDGDTTLAAAFAFVPNRGDAWSGIVTALADRVDAASAGPDYDFPLSVGGLLGRRTAELHRAFATPTDDPDFAVHPLTAATLRDWSRDAVAEAQAMLARLSQASLPEEAAPVAARVLERRDQLLGRLRQAGDLVPSGGLSRIHGDYHLGQVLLVPDDVAIIDFEGEPSRSLAERRALGSPLRDVAGMLRSFDYAAATVAARHRAAGTASAKVLNGIEEWRQAAGSAFLDDYLAHATGAANLPSDRATIDPLLDLFLLQKAVYETGYELGNRPAWVGIPLAGILELLMQETA